MWCRPISPAFALVLAAAGCGDYPPQPDYHHPPGESIQAALSADAAHRNSWIVQIQPGVYENGLGRSLRRHPHRRKVTGSGGRPPDPRWHRRGGRLLKDTVIVSGAYFTMQASPSATTAATVTTNKTTTSPCATSSPTTPGVTASTPVESEDIIIDNCVATGISDAGIYVGQSRRATVTNCRVYKNVAGIEIENTVDALVENNEAYDNTAGLWPSCCRTTRARSARTARCATTTSTTTTAPTGAIRRSCQGAGRHRLRDHGRRTAVIENNQITGNRSVGVAIIGLAQLVRPTGIDVEADRTGPCCAEHLLRQQRDPGSGPGQGGLQGGDILWDGHSGTTASMSRGR